MSDETTLLPCPICGKKVSIARTENEVGERWWFITRGTYKTTRCNCRLFLESEKFTCGWNDDYSLECRVKLIDKWNTRAPIEYDGWFYLPKPKKNIVQYGEMSTEKTENGYKMQQPVEVIESAIRSYSDELGEYIMKRICEAWNTRHERTCKCVAEHVCSPFDGKTIVLHRCSVCHELMRPYMKYCPGCGAKVIEEPLCR